MLYRTCCTFLYSKHHMTHIHSFKILRSQIQIQSFSMLFKIEADLYIVDQTICLLHLYWQKKSQYVVLTFQIDGTNDRDFTFDQLHEEVRHVTNSLGSLGLRHGDVACLCGTNVPEFAHIFCSVTALGAALTIANSQLTPGTCIANTSKHHINVLTIYAFMSLPYYI
jgi:hypothetical protein